MYLEKYDLTGRVAVVTGGGRGIGHATATALGEAGAILVIAEINRETGERGTQALVERGFVAEFMEMNVTEPGRVREVAEAVAKKHGRIDVLLNNAGIVYSTDALEISDAEWLEVIDVNLNGVYWCCREFGK